MFGLSNELETDFSAFSGLPFTGMSSFLAGIWQVNWLVSFE